MSNRRIHWQKLNFGMLLPVSRCGLWYSPFMTRIKEDVTCRACQRYFTLAGEHQ